VRMWGKRMNVAGNTTAFRNGLTAMLIKALA